jgi:cytochrome c peroxidase
MRVITNLTIVLLILFSGCKKETKVISVYKDEYWKFVKPEGFPSTIYSFENNEQSELRFELGRSLFYDPILSSDNSTSCSTCHAQAHSFSDHNVALSTGVLGLKGHRNAPALINLVWNKSFMWDGGVNHIEVQPLVPLTSPFEMNETLDNVVHKLNNNATYKSKFKAAYNVDVITSQKMLQALTQFMGMLTSSDTKYDRYIAGKETLSDKEKRGLIIFRQKCTACHVEPLFTDYSFRNIGLDSISIDIGRELVSQNTSDKGKFKVPTLRNVAETYPYMHDGRYFTLNQLLNHHINGAINTATTDSYLLNITPLTSNEKLDIIDFLMTLTDYTLIGNMKFSEPQK